MAEPEVELALIDEDAEIEELDQPEQLDEWTPPSKEEWEKHQKELKRAQDQAVKLRQRAKEQEQTKEPADDIEKVKAEAAKAVEDKYKARIVHSEARAQLTAMGLQGDATKLLKLIDLDDVDLEDDDIIGLSTQLESLKEDFPTLFPAPKTVKADPRTKSDAAPKQENKPPVSSADRIAQALLGK